MSGETRYLMGEALPTSPYLPGRGPRPPAPFVRRSFGPTRWREDDAYLWGVDLYNAGFAWEAHEAWEAAWRQAGGRQRELLQGLIQCAAACVKIGSGDLAAALRLAERGASHLLPVGTLMGIDAPAFGRAVVRWVESEGESEHDIGARPLLSLPLRRVLTTARLNVRQLVAEDLDALAAICAEPETMRYVGDGEPLARERVELLIARAIESYQARPHALGTWAVCSREDGALVGYAGIAYPDGVPELVYTLGAAYWGRGLGTELAAAVLAYALERLPSVTATVDPRHEPSRRILRRLGFVLSRTGLDEHGLPTESVEHRARVTRRATEAQRRRYPPRA